MKIGIERYNKSMDDYMPIQVYFNIPENGGYIDFLQQMQVKSYDRVWVEKNKQVCVPCRIRRILTYQFGIQGVEVHEFED